MDVIHAFLIVKMVTNRTKHHIWVIFGILKFKNFWNLSPYSFQTTIIVFQSLFKQSTKHLPSIGALEHFETVCKEGKGNKLIIIHFYTNTPREKWPNTEFLLIHIFPYLDWIRAGKNSRFGHFSRSINYQHFVRTRCFAINGIKTHGQRLMKKECLIL